MQALCWFRAIRTLVSGTFPVTVHFCPVHSGYQLVPLPRRGHPWPLETVTLSRSRQDGASGPIGGPGFSSSCADPPSISCTR